MRHKLSVVISCFLLVCLPGEITSQVALSKAEKNQKKRQAIITYSEQTIVTIRSKLQSDFKVNISSIFDVESVGLTNVSGSLLLTLPETERLKLKEAFAVNLKKIPHEIEIKNIHADILPDSKCPSVKILVPAQTASFLDGTISLQKQTMILDTQNAKLDIEQYFCLWISKLNSNDSHSYRILRLINKRIWMIKNNKKKCCD